MQIQKWLIESKAVLQDWCQYAALYCVSPEYSNVFLNILFSLSALTSLLALNILHSLRSSTSNEINTHFHQQLFNKFLRR